MFDVAAVTTGVVCHDHRPRERIARHGGKATAVDDRPDLPPGLVVQPLGHVPVGVTLQHLPSGAVVICRGGASQRIGYSRDLVLAS